MIPTMPLIPWMPTTPLVTMCDPPETIRPRVSFDVGRVLRIGTHDASPLPVAEEGEIVLRVAKGLSLVRLRDSTIGQRLLSQQYYRHRSARTPVPPGVYHLRIPVPGCCGKSFSEQRALLSEREAPAPAALVVAALLCMRQCGQPDPLNELYTRCAESAAAGHRIVVSWRNGQLFTDIGYNESEIPNVGLSSVRTS